MYPITGVTLFDFRREMTDVERLGTALKWQASAGRYEYNSVRPGDPVYDVVGRGAPSYCPEYSATYFFGRKPDGAVDDLPCAEATDRKQVRTCFMPPSAAVILIEWKWYSSTPEKVSVYSTLPRDFEEEAIGAAEAFLEREAAQAVAEEEAKRAAEAEARRKFARDQMALLVARGLSQTRAYRIMQAAGPGQVRPALEWLDKVFEALSAHGRNERDVRDAIDALLQGTGGKNGFGRERTIGALEALNLPVPACSGTAHQLFGALRGAHVAIQSGYRPPAQE